MERKFTRDMVCKEFGGTCKECPLSCRNNFKALPCNVLTDNDIDSIMKDYPYADVKVRMIFNDIDTRLTAVEKKVSNDAFSAEVVDKNLYDKLEAKHEADCRLISEYDLEIKELKKANSLLDRINKFYTEDIQRAFEKQLKAEETANILKAERKAMSEHIDELKSDAESWEKRYKELEYMYEKKDAECNNLEDSYRRHNADLKSRLFDLKNVENERDHYKGLYSTKCDDYDALLAKQLKTEKEFTFYRNAYYECCSANDDHIEKERDLKEELITLTEQKDHYKNLFHSLNPKYKDLEQKLKETEEKYNDACILNKMREDVFEANIKLQKTIEAKDREIGLLRAELDKYKTDDECDDRWID